MHAESGPHAQCCHETLAQTWAPDDIYTGERRTANSSEWDDQGVQLGGHPHKVGLILPDELILLPLALVHLPAHRKPDLGVRSKLVTPTPVYQQLTHGKELKTSLEQTALILVCAAM